MARERPLGFLRPGTLADVVMMVCTAGHVDHGKTSLVKLLTGCETDRLREEKERGLTIELGFAPCFLGGDRAVGIVDVPGHEKFIRNMVAGVPGIDLTILVIAADDGVMPQTVEHLRIMELLGVTRGIVALTKIDLVSPEQVTRRVDEIRAFLAETPLAGARICPVSSETGEGFAEFYGALTGAIDGAEKRRRGGVFRMPVERVFSPKGVGTVVSGIPLAGDIRLGDDIEIVPGGKRGRVRGIQRFLRDAVAGSYGQCLALQLSDVEREDVARGHVVAAPGFPGAGNLFHVRFRGVPEVETPLKNGEAVHLHTGTAEAPGRFYPLGATPEGVPGDVYGCILTSEPVPAAEGDRYILRRASPAVTVGGGEILFAEHAPRRPRRKVSLALVGERDRIVYGERFAGDPEAAAVAVHLRLRESGAADTGRIARGALLSESAAAAALARVAATGEIVESEPGRYVHGAILDALTAAARARLEELAGQGRLTASLGEVRVEGEGSGALRATVLDRLATEGTVSRNGPVLILENALRRLPDADRDLVRRLCVTYEEAGFTSPRPDDLPELLGAPRDRVRRLLDYLFRAGVLVRLNPNVVLTAENVRKAQRMVVSIIGSQGSLDSADFKYTIDSTRKYALAILDFFDGRGLTRRDGNLRYLAPQYRDRLL